MEENPIFASHVIACEGIRYSMCLKVIANIVVEGGTCSLLQGIRQLPIQPTL